MIRLCAIAEFPREIVERPADVFRPIRVGISFFDPWTERLELLRCRCERDAVGEVEATIAECEELRSEKVFASKTSELHRVAGEHDDESLVPVGRKITQQCARAVVEP